MSQENSVEPTNDSNSNINPINNYTDLINLLKIEQKRLNKKSIKSYWLRYVFRRIPLFFCTGFLFFAACLAMAMIKDIGLNSVNLFLNDLIPFDTGYRNYIFGGSLLLLVVRGFIPWGAEFAKTTWHKAITNALLFTLLAAVLLIVISSKFPLVFGLAVFSVVTLLSILIDRTLGFTRRNERYQLFEGRAESLQVLFVSRNALNIPFAESHLLELAKFWEELRLSKHNDTVSDSHYLLALVEQLKGASK